MKRACNTLRHQLVARMWSELNIQTGGLTTVRTTNNLDVNTPVQLWTLFGWSSQSEPYISVTGPWRGPRTHWQSPPSHNDSLHNGSSSGGDSKHPHCSSQMHRFSLGTNHNVQTRERFQTELPLYASDTVRRTSLLRVLWSQCFTSSETSSEVTLKW